MGAPATANSTEGATELTAPSVYLGHKRKHLYVCRNAAVVMPKHFNFISMFPSILVDAVVALSLCGMNAIYISVFLEIE